MQSAKRRVIGVDEAGKGDFFGPLVVAAFLASDDEIPALEQLGVRDSKDITDNRIQQIDEQLRTRYPYIVLVTMPETYNKEYQAIKNLNILLAQKHAEVITNLVKKQEADLAISDKFGKPELIEKALRNLKQTIDIDQFTGGERIPQVAAASILARAEFVRQMDQLSKQYGMTIPKGAAAHVDQAGRELVARKGAEILFKVAKTHFKNYTRAMTGSLIS